MRAELRKDGFKADEISRIPAKMDIITRQVSELSQIHHNIARLAVLGRKPIEIARELDVSLSMVRNALALPQIKEKISIINGAQDKDAFDAARRIQGILPKAIELLESTIDDGLEGIDKELASRNALALLSAGGFGPQKNINVRGGLAVLSKDDILEINSRAETIRGIGGFIAESAS